MIAHNCNTTQAAGPEGRINEWQSHLIRRICAKFLEARAVLDRQTYIPGGVAGLVDDAAGFFDALAVSVPRPIIVSATAALRPPVKAEPVEEQPEPLPRWLMTGDAGDRHE